MFIAEEIDQVKMEIDQVKMPPIPLTALPTGESLSILILPDLHIPSGQLQMQLLLDNREFLDRHDWVVLLGDITNCYGTPGEYEQVDQFINKLNRPYSVVNGNHEFAFLPMPDGSSDYGKKWIGGPISVQQSQIERFNHFYGIESCFQTTRHPTAAITTLGLDGIGPNGSGLINDGHQEWFEQSLREARDLPMIVFSHFPIQDARLDRIRYYQPGLLPCYQPSAGVRRELQARPQPTFWFSGHLHFRPPHRLSNPYKSELGPWQIHCPDARGYGRLNNKSWSPQRYEGLFVRSVLLNKDRLSVVTTDLYRGRERAHRIKLTSTVV